MCLYESLADILLHAAFVKNSDELCGPVTKECKKGIQRFSFCENTHLGFCRGPPPHST